MGNPVLVPLTPPFFSFLLVCMFLFYLSCLMHGRGSLSSVWPVVPVVIVVVVFVVVVVILPLYCLPFLRA